jgi:hypothetical protein
VVLRHALQRFAVLCHALPAEHFAVLFDTGLLHHSAAPMTMLAAV